MQAITKAIESFESDKAAVLEPFSQTATHLSRLVHEIDKAAPSPELLMQINQYRRVSTCSLEELREQLKAASFCEQLNASNSRAQTYLTELLRYGLGDEETIYHKVGALLEAGASPSIPGGVGVLAMLPLHLAAEKGWTKVMSLLMAHGAKLEAQSGPRALSLMHIAAKYDQLNVIEWLYTQVPALLDAPDSRGYTPLHHAAEQGQADAVRVLKRLGANLEAKTLETLNTPLQLAANKRQLVAAHILHALGADIEAINAEGNTAAHILVAPRHEPIKEHHSLGASHPLHSKEVRPVLFAMVLAKPEIACRANKQGATMPSLIEDKELAEAVTFVIENDKHSSVGVLTKAGCGADPTL